MGLNRWMSGRACSIDLNTLCGRGEGKVVQTMGSRECHLAMPQMTLNGGNLSVERAWRIVDDLYLQAVQPSAPVGNLEVEIELLFCLMGGFGITYEHGRSAAEVIWQLRDVFGRMGG